LAETTSVALPKPDELLADIAVSSISTDEAAANEVEFNRQFRDYAVESEFQYVHLQGVIEHYSQKADWSRFLMYAIGGMVVFQSLLLLFVGFGILDFTKYSWLLPALLVQNLGQVVGLAVWAVKYLFSDIRWPSRNS
jgi:hypothetical protein